MNKAEILKRSFFRCKHGHSGLQHPKCYETETGTGEKIGFFDIECFTLNFKANSGLVITYAIYTNEGEIITNFITPKELRQVSDERIMRNLCKDLRKFDRIITYYGKRFDMPFVRTRCELYELVFPVYKELIHTDVYDVIKRKFQFTHNTLQIACRFFNIPAKGHSFQWFHWARAFQGNKESMDWILKHNIEDVECLKMLWDRVNKYTNITATSI
jgi:uncharacterized protein YprB with RNaseH-like and TPR domain